MSHLIRSARLKGLLVLASALMVAQCGSDDECTHCGDSGPSEPKCVNEDLTAGLYSFSIVDQVDDCADMFSLLKAFGLIPDGPYPIQLPAYGDLPQSVTLTLPLPGSPQVSGTLSEVSGDIVLAVPGTTQIFVDLSSPAIPEYLPDSISFTVTIGGTLCPVSQTRVDTDLAITLPQAVPPFTNSGCNIDATLRGTR